MIKNRKFQTHEEGQSFLTKLTESLAKLFPGASVRYIKDGDEQRATGLDFASGASWWFRYDDWTHRLAVSGNWPKSNRDSQVFIPRDLYNPQVSSPEITVDADKTPEKIAADINRRFVPAYIAILARLTERRDSHDKYIDDSNGLAEQLAKALGASAPRHPSNGTRDVRRQHVDVPSTLGFYGNIEASSNSADFTLRSVPADKALKLARFLATLND